MAIKMLQDGKRTGEINVTILVVTADERNHNVHSFRMLQKRLGTSEVTVEAVFVAKISAVGSHYI